MADTYVQHKGNLSAADASTNRRASPAIWSDCPVERIMLDPGVGYGHQDDFSGGGYDFATNTAVTQIGEYEIFTGNGPSLAGSVTIPGAQTFVSGTSADVAAQMVLGGGAPFVISDTAGADKKLWFEARFKISAVVDADQVQFFIGLTEEDRSVANGTFADAGGDLGFTTTIDLLGFGRFDNDGDSLSLCYQKASQTAQDTLQNAIAADTYIKCGFVYDPAADTAKRISVFFDNVINGTFVTGTNIAAATFPDAEELTMVIAVQNDSTTTNTLTVDWWRCFQLSP